MNFRFSIITKIHWAVSELHRQLHQQNNSSASYFLCVFMKGQGTFIYLSWLKISQLSKTETCFVIEILSIKSNKSKKDFDYDFEMRKDFVVVSWLNTGRAGFSLSEKSQLDPRKLIREILL
ncbi:hypothetical protein EK904_008714 [Melospiza melodia maxima]|nr:hypothetical protein EK904_008714 [Melospiza melodia maxima]